jgi:hypothetical protein
LVSADRVAIRCVDQTGDKPMRRLADLKRLKNTTLADFDQEELEWREIAEAQVENLAMLDDSLPTPAELDELDPDEAISRIEESVENNGELCYCVDSDTRTWGDVAIARQRARAKAMKKKREKAKKKPTKAKTAVDA